MNIKLYGTYADEKTENIVKTLSKIDGLQGEHISIMPDNHFNGEFNPPIGFTFTNKNKKIIPNLIGGDIGCGLTRVPLKIKEFKLLDEHIRENIPTGYNNRYTPLISKKADSILNKMSIPLNDIQKRKIMGSLGTLGGGNHFIEISDEFLVIHSGSRNFGQVVYKYHAKKAEKNMMDKLLECEPLQVGLSKLENKDKSAFVKQWKKKQNDIINKNKQLSKFAYLEEDDFDLYVRDMKLAQEFALLNRLTMIQIILDFVDKPLGKITNTFHNYLDDKTLIGRKGAVESKIGEEFDIAFNMKDGILVCEGIKNNESNQSAPHGAGRYMSRSAIKKILNMKDFINDMKGIYSTSVTEYTLDESPRAYKEKDKIYDELKELATPKYWIKPIYNFKDCD